MICRETEYYNFRNIKEKNIKFSDRVNVIYGDNAQGKTNILESIYLFSSTKSFRTKKEEELISFGSDRAEIKMLYYSEKTENKMSIQYFKNEKRLLKKNGVTMEKVSEFIGNFRSILFSPDHLSMVKDGPFYRRNFLDMAIAQIRPSYVRFYQKYSAILRQRNCLLREASKGTGLSDTIEIFDIQLAQAASVIAVMRQEYLQKLEEAAAKIYSEIALQKEKFEIIYQSEEMKEKADKDTFLQFYLKKYSENKEREIRYGTTLFGPHRDDFSFYLDGNDARLYASQGQARSIVLALKLAEGEISKELCGEYPVFLLDDILSELDMHRQSFLLSLISDRQIIITSCIDETLKSFPQANQICIQNGKVEQ